MLTLQFQKSTVQKPVGGVTVAVSTFYLQSMVLTLKNARVKMLPSVAVSYL